MKIILFGGSFDPIHNGHLEIANKALAFLNADLVIFILNNKSINKKCDAIYNDRWAMLNLAIKDNKKFIASDYELKNKEDISYTIDTVHYFCQRYPNDELYFLVGSDQFERFDQWKNANELLDLIKIIVYPRLGYLPNDKIDKKQIIYLNNEIINIASSSIKNNNEWYNLPKIVNDYINEHGLYYFYHYKLFNISEKRILHSLRTAKMAFNVMMKNEPKLAHLAWTAGVYHDVCKCESQDWLENKAYQIYHLPKSVSWKVLHGPVAAIYLKEKLNFNNQLILNAIDRHTLPLEKTTVDELTLLDKILFCCDKLEPNRTNDDVPNIEYYRHLLNKNVNQCFNELLQKIESFYEE